MLRRKDGVIQYKIKTFFYFSLYYFNKIHGSDQE